MSAEQRIAELEAIVARQREQIERLRAYIRGYLATVRKQGHAPLAALNTVCAGQPLYLESA